ncbi:hypothetical protein ACFLQI_03415 [Candidatus Undinarchaeota archaeon]
MPNQKSPLLAAILSLILPGAGQLYKGQKDFGLKLLIVGLIVMWSGGIGTIYRLIIAWDAYTGKLSKALDEKKAKPAPKRKSAPAAKKKPKKKLKVSKPKAPGIESHEKVLVRTLLKLAQEDKYYRLKVIQNKLAEAYPSEQSWLTDEWLGRTLNKLGFIEKRRMSKGMDVRLSPANVRKVARKFKVLVYS